MTTPGALYEMVARGNKDVYFFSNELTKTESPFSTSYKSSAPRLSETRTTTPSNAVDFGKMVEFELEPFADVLSDLYIQVQMPSWLPSLPLVSGGTTYPSQDANYQYHITSAGNSYGWMRGIGYYLFEKIQILQDLVLIQEISGDSLWALDSSAATNVQYFLLASQAGMHNGSAREIAANATPPTLKMRIPFPGCQGRLDGGFPLCCMKGQTFRVRLYLRRAEVLWESFTPTNIAPWDATFVVPTTGGDTTVNGVGRSSLGTPTLLLESRQNYLPPDHVEELKKRHLEIPFVRYYDETFTIGEADYLPLDGAGVSLIQRRMEGRHPIERLLINFRLAQWFRGGQMWRSGANDFYNSMGLLVAGTDREYAWPSLILREVNGFAKDSRFANGREMSEIRWSIPEGDHRLQLNRQPTGAVNFTTASRPTLTIDLKNVPADPECNARLTYLQICGEGWGVYEVKNGRGRLMFLD
jgi:hypothetical protein